MVDLNGHKTGNRGYSQRKPKAHRVSSTRNLLIEGISFFLLAHYICTGVGVCSLHGRYVGRVVRPKRR